MKNLLKIALTLLIGIVMSVGIFRPGLLMGTPASLAVSNWYQQFVPNIGSRSIQDIFFLDSLTGWAVTNATNQNPDTIFVLKTINGGDNWIIHYRKVQTGGGFSGYFKIYFLDQNTGYTTDVRGIYKTSDGGSNWTTLNAPQTAYLDLSVLSTDTIWIVTPEPFAGGVFFTSTGGANWVQQYSAGSQNPEKIYMYNARIGFISDNSGTPSIRKTTNGGLNWNLNLAGEYFTDMHFIDSLTGWKCSGSDIAFIRKTTNGGINWIVQNLPPEAPPFLFSRMNRFSFINADTIWGVGGTYNFGSGIYRGILYKTTNGGGNWGYQIPDTTLQIPGYSFVQFIDKNKGWAYHVSQGGIHTNVGGDTTILSVQLISNETPIEFKLYQNYPNPFNPVTNIKFRLLKPGNAEITIYDITGRRIQKLLNDELNAGEYEIDFNGAGLSSGVYFYNLTVNSGKEVFTDTKKMVLIK